MKKQVFVIHGGNAFETYEEYLEDLEKMVVNLDRLRRKDWKATLQDKLGDGYEVLLPKMPNAQNARYAEWKIYFEKFLPLLDKDVIFIGHSLGGIFLAKYFSEEKCDKRIHTIMLVAAPYNTLLDHPLVDFNLSETLPLLKEQVQDIYIYHSQDDEVVPFSSFKRYQKELPDAHTRIFDDRGHFNQEDFAEMVFDITKLIV